MKFALAAGGTAGHINPALATAEELVSRGHEVIMIGNPKGLEARLVAEAGFEFVGVSCAGFDRAHLRSALGSIRQIQRGASVLKRRFKENPIDCVVGFGAYVELPAVMAARKLKVPYLLHEQNSVPGLANRYAAKHAALVVISYPASELHFKKRMKRGAECLCLGNPVRSSVLQADASLGRESLGIGPDKEILLVFGGSLGARHLNERLIEQAQLILKDPQRVVVQAAGAKDFERSKSQLNQVLSELIAQGRLSESDKERWILLEYIKDMGPLMKAADLIVSRAGASSLAEISALAVPALLVPYPHARADHQRLNAAHLVSAQAAQMISDAELDLPDFAQRLEAFLSDKDAAQAMRMKALELAGEGAACKLANAIEMIAERSTRARL